MSASNPTRFTDSKANDIVRGWIVVNGTKRIKEKFPSFDPRCLQKVERLIFECACSLELQGVHPDIITITQSLVESGQLSQVGGPDKIVPGHDTDEVVWSSIRSLNDRWRNAQASEIGSKLCEGLITPEDAIKQIEAISSTSSEGRRSRVFDNKKLASYKATEDPDGLLGINGAWIRKGKCALFFGPSGAGKSSLRTHAAITWALGKSWFGIEPRGQLRSLIMQAENGEGDEAEPMQDIARALGSSVEELDNRVIIAEAWCTGKDFTAELDYLLKKYPVDLVWIDPLFSFAGDDLSLQRPASQFLREELDPVLRRYQVGAFLLHHQGKAPRGKQERDQLDPSNTYFGSVELSAFPRAMMALNQREDRSFELLASKRGRRAGLRNLDGDHVEKIFLKHADVGIGWEQLPGVSEDSEDGGNRGKDRIEEYVKCRKRFAPYTKELVRECRERIMQEMSLGERSVKLYEARFKELHVICNSMELS
jgi:hypothetical protein